MIGETVARSRPLAFAGSFLALQLFVVAYSWLYGWGHSSEEIIQGLLVSEIIALVAAWFASAPVKLGKDEKMLAVSRRGIIRGATLGLGVRFGRVLLTNERIGVSEFPFPGPFPANWRILSDVEVSSDGAVVRVRRRADGVEEFRFRVSGEAEARAWAAAATLAV